MKENYGPSVLNELIELQLLQRLQEDFSAATGLATSILDAEGHVLTSSGWTELCARFHRVSPAAAARCRDSDQRIVQEVMRKQGRVVRICDHGLARTAIPIRIAGRHVATVTAGQVFFAAPDEDRFRTQAREYGFDEDSYLAAVRDVRVLSETVFLQTVRFFANVTGLISSLGQRNWEQTALGEEFRRQRASLEAVFHGSGDAMRIIGKDYRVIRQNREMERLSGVKEQDCLGRKCSDVFPHPFCESTNCILRRILSGTERIREDLRMIRPDGRRIDVSITATPLRDESGAVIGVIESLQDITERIRAEEAQREGEQRLKTIMDSIQTGIVVIDPENHVIVDANRVALEMLGLARQEAVGAVCHRFICAAEKGQCPITDLGQHVDHAERELITGTGERLPIIKSVVPAMLGGKRYLIESFTDISERKRMEQQLVYLSLHDPLTGLYNRAYFEEEMRRLEGGRIERVGIITCDLDGLKLDNDTLGHGAGDALLRVAGELIAGCFREGDVVARVGGDEFAVLLPGSADHAVEDACRRIREALADYGARNPEIPLSLSIGFAVGSSPSIALAELFKEADNNMYREKLHHSRNTRSAIVQTLIKALETKDFINQGHADRLQALVTVLAKSLGLTGRRMDGLRLLAQFHDIGKVGISERILFKPEALTPEEQAEMRRHCEIGHRIALSVPELVPIADLILKHHEWWNGEGYPLGLRGDEIPLECRILALADAYDAMTSSRPYRRPVSREEAVAELKRCAGIQFDPQLVPRFMDVALVKASGS